VGVSGQLLTLAWVLVNLWGGLFKNSLPSPQFAAFEALVLVSILMIWPYATKSMRGMIEANVVKPGQAQREDTIKPAENQRFQPEEVKQVAPASPPRSWSLL
jgi:hypothetical protein